MPYTLGYTPGFAGYVKAISLKAMDEFAQVFAQFQDHLAPRLDVYEQAIYPYVLRHTFVESKREVVIGFKSARKKLAFGTGKVGTPPSEHFVYEKLRSLQSKGCVEILSSERAGTRVKINLPSEIPGLIPPPPTAADTDIEQRDFFTTPENRKRILERENWRCFYCLAKLDENNHVIEHVVSRPEGATHIGMSWLLVGAATIPKAPVLWKTSSGRSIEGASFLATNCLPVSLSWRSSERASCGLRYER